MSARSGEEHVLKTVFDVAELFANLDEQGRAILVQDLCAAGEALQRRSLLFRKLTTMNTMTWIDDDKGRGSMSVSATAKGPVLFSWALRRRQRKAGA